MAQTEPSLEDQRPEDYRNMAEMECASAAWTAQKTLASQQAFRWGGKCKCKCKGKEKGKRKVVVRLPREKRADLEGIVPWRAKDGKDPTIESMLEPKESVVQHEDLDSWKALWSPDRTKMMFTLM